MKTGIPRGADLDRSRPARLEHTLCDVHNLIGIRPHPAEDTHITESVPRDAGVARGAEAPDGDSGVHGGDPGMRFVHDVYRHRFAC